MAHGNFKVSRSLAFLILAILYALAQPWYHPRRSSTHGAKEEKEETNLKSTEPFDPYAADHLRRDRGACDRFFHPQYDRLRRRNQNAKLPKALIY